MSHVLVADAGMKYNSATDMSRLKFVPVLIVFIFVCGTFTHSQSSKPAAKEAPTTTVTAVAPVPAPDYSREAFVTEELKTYYRFEEDGTGVRTMTARLRVQSEAALAELGQLVFGYSSANERINLGYVRVRKADGSVITAADTAVQDMTSPVAREAPVYTDFREKHITVPALRPGEVLEYEVTSETYAPLAPRQFWMAHTFAATGIVLDETLIVDVPRDRTLKLKVKPGFDVKITEENGRKIYRWAHANLSRPEDEKDKKTGKKSRRPKPQDAADVQMTTFQGWGEVGTWYAGLEKERRAVTPELKAKSDALTKDKATDTEKIEAIYDYVAKNFRYVSLSFGVGRYQPHAASEVFTNGYGDCKDKHTLLATLLNAAGFTTDTVLIHSTRKLDAEVPSPAQFDHVISRVHTSDGTIWLDTTSEVAPYRVLMMQLRKKNALLIEPGGKATVEETPADLPFSGQEDSWVDGKITELGVLQAHVKHVSRGDSELMIRMALRRVSQAHWKRIVEYLASVELAPGEITDFKLSDPAATNEPFVIEYWISVPNYLEWTRKNSKLRVPLPIMQVTEAPETEEGEEQEPFRVGAPGVMAMHSTIAIPAKFKLRLPLPVEVKREFADYKSSYKMDGQTLNSERQLTIKQFELPPEKLREFSSFRRVLNSDTKQEIGVEQAEVGTGVAPSDAKADDLAEAATAASREGNYKIAAELYERVVVLEPKHKTAWNQLGRAYLNLAQFQKAISALAKQIEVNPYDEWAYNNMGLAYWRLRDYAEAEKAFRKQLEVNPLDVYAHANLGQMFADQKQWDAALPELETASQITPDNPSLSLRLGEAYLNSNKAEKAMEVFEATLEKTPGPLVWNDVAYFLADQGLFLDRAKKYSEAAVGSVSSALRNMPEEQLVKVGAALTSMLASYWDTLGWVYFRMGDVDRAEKYLAGAWQLEQHGEVGEHLGQLYEKQGDKDRAKDYYAMALASTTPQASARQHLAPLVGGDANVDAVVNRYRAQLGKDRTVQFSNAAKISGSAEFTVTLDADGKAQNVKAQKDSFKAGVKPSGNKEDAQKFLDDLSARLRQEKFPVSFPDGAAPRIVRKVFLTCGDAKECTAVLALADDAANSSSPVLLSADGTAVTPVP
ncbi:MAG TPA: DUF3857 domain-containing protein [Clostridia bacterium]|nr:DUF3857 domain-containing protein [Clostridia bacterium]